MKVLKSVLLFFLAMNSFGNHFESILFTDSTQFIDFPKSKIGVYVDTSGYESLDEVIRSNHDFVHPTEDIIKELNQGYWMNFTVENRSNRETDWVLEFDDPHISEIQVFEKIGDSIMQFPKAGFSYVFSNKMYEHKSFAYELHVPYGSRMEVFVRCKSNIYSLYHFRLMSHKYFTNSSLEEYYLLGIFYGIILIMAAYNLIQYFQVRENTYLYYVFYLVASVSNTFFEDGLGFQYLWPNHPVINYALQAAAPLILPITFFFYYDNLVGLKTRLPEIRKTLIVATSVSVTYMTFIRLNGIDTFYWVIVTPVPFIVTLIAAIKVIRQGYLPARYFLAGNVVVLVCHLIYLLRITQFVPTTFFTTYVFNFGFVIEAVLLSIAMGDKLREEKEKNILRKKRQIDTLRELQGLKDGMNKALEQQVKERTEELHEKQKELSDFNKYLLDSINYAQRIQESILPDKEILYKEFEDAFVINLPKDVVSGDFYWYNKFDNKFVLGVADCTGHGVPGALMSMIGYTQLNTIVLEKAKSDPAEILSRLDVRIKSALRREHNDKYSVDGIDIGLCVFHESGLLEFSGAGRPLYIVRNNALKEIKGDRITLGDTAQKEVRFRTNRVQLEKGDVVYLFTDGFADQFGGEKNRKYFLKNFKSLLVSVSDLPLQTQRELIREEFLKWKGEQFQVDDVMILGIRY